VQPASSECSLADPLRLLPLCIFGKSASTGVMQEQPAHHAELQL
jgi:hypothetical protein